MDKFAAYKINDEELGEVNGGTAQAAVEVTAITPIWVRVTASTLNCGYTPAARSPRSTREAINSKSTVLPQTGTGTDS